MTDTPADVRQLGQLVRRLRDTKGWTQVQLGDAIGMSQRWVSDLERGATKLPRPAALRRLADALDVDVAELYIAGQIARTRAEAQRVNQLLREADGFWKPRGEWTPREEAIAELGQLARTLGDADLEGLLVIARRLADAQAAGR